MQLQQIGLAFLLAATAVLLASAQSGAYPARLSITGAVPIPAARPEFRSAARVRRPIALRSQNTLVPAITPRILEEPKPVTEAPEDEQPDVYLPQLLREQQLAQTQQAQFHQTAAAFFGNEPNSIQLDTSPLLEEAAPSSARFPERGQQSPPAPSLRPAFNDYGIGSNIGGAQRYGLERPHPPTQPQAPVHQQQAQQHQPQHRVNVIRSRPAVRDSRPQFEAAPAPPPPAQRPRPKPIQARPIIDQNQLQDEREAQTNRRQRPVAQTLRKWREENEDGSITWGYENDDGSFKEEFIGTDCVTKGTYGYVDPDGNKREYHYETGIKCDPNTRLTDDDLQQQKDGFINYEENKAVLPNGIEIDMSQLGKKKSRRPGANYAN